LSYIARLQLPFIPERYYTKNGGINIGEFLMKYSYDPSWVTPEVREVIQAAYQNWPTAHTAIEFHRWAIRSLYRNDGRHFQDSIERPISPPVLDIFGEYDRMIIHDLVENKSVVSGSYTRAIMPTGHFPHEENPRAFFELLLPWLRQHAGP
jgi:pimeloyl-ACP methyl ester carboxylesterase